MKHFFTLVFLIITTIALAQQETVNLEWNGSTSYQVGDQSIDLPYFENGFVYDSEKLIFSQLLSTNGKIDPLSANFSNIDTQTIPSSELLDLDRSQIPSRAEMVLSNALSRKRNYAHIQFNPIYKDGNSYRRINSFTVTYSTASPEAIAKNSNFTNSALASGDWFKFRVDKTGVHRITRAFLDNLGMDVSNIDPRRIKIYGQGGTSLPLVNAENEFYDPAQIAISVTGAADGRFDSGDEILFYGVATDTEYVAENDSFINPYTDESIYYITASGGDGKRVLPQINSNSNATVTYDYYQSTKFHEVDERNIGLIGRLWYGERFSIEPEQTFEFEFNNLISSRPATVRITTGAISDVSTSMSFTINGQSLGTSTFTGLANDNIAVARRALLFNNNVTLSNGDVSVALTYNNAGIPASQGYLDYIRIDAFESLTGIGEQFSFTVPEASTSSGVGRYQFSKAAAISEVWEVTDRFNITKIENTESLSDFSFISNLGTARKFIAIDRSDFFAPISVNNSRVANQNLKGTIFNDVSGNFRDVDYLIITPQFLQSQAQRLANYHVRESNLNVKVVLLDQIYSEFSEGRQDISAIRNFVKYVYDNASDPSRRVQYLNMFGDTSYDYKDRIPVQDNIVPSFLSANSTSLTSSYVTDDFFTYMDPLEGTVATNNLMDLAVGRMIVSTVQEAREMVDKIESYTAVLHLIDGVIISP